MDISAKTTILQQPVVSSTAGETNKYESNLVGGAKKNKKSKKTAKRSSVKRTTAKRTTAKRTTAKRTKTTRKSCGWFW